MCGLIGVASNYPQTERDWLNAARDTLAHRGPDDAGTWWSKDGRVGLAHRRLSIIDLSPLGHQPMHDIQRNLSIVFNGEIYNFANLRHELKQLGHSFYSNSDTEVLLASYSEWGRDCLSRLNGMFAFAIYDAKNYQLFLARDRAGEKPLFYCQHGQTIFFSSELKALLANLDLKRYIDPAALDCYLAMGFVPGDACILKGYHKLPPAHAMIFDIKRGARTIWRYWQPPELDINASAENPIKLVNELESLLGNAVRQQLVADVPVGVLLSGGLDSSLVTAMAARHSNHLHTFCVGFEGNNVLSEAPHANLIAKHFGTLHTELMAKPTHVAELIPILAKQFDEPIVDSSMLPTWLVSNMVRQHCTVALGGDGADELFGGYKHYSRLLWLHRNLSLMPAWLRKGLSAASTQAFPIGFKGKNYLQCIDYDLRNSLPLIACYFDHHSRRQLMHKHPNFSIMAENIYINRIPEQKDFLQRATRMDFNNYLAEDILVKVDRASMLNSLEIRAPFLDAKLMEFAFKSVPSHLKATAQSRKILLKLLANKLLPPEFDRHRKQGFSIPMTEWLKTGPLRDLFWDTLDRSDGFFDQKTVRSLLKGQDQGRNNGERLFALVQFELWRKIYNAKLL